MPFQLDTKVNQLHCSWCEKIVRDNPIVVKTCCNNKPWVFCSKQCYDTGWESGSKGRNKNGDKKKTIVTGISGASGIIYG